MRLEGAHHAAGQLQAGLRLAGAARSILMVTVVKETARDGDEVL